MTERQQQCSSTTTITEGDRSRRIQCERTTRTVRGVSWRSCGGPHRAETGKPILTDNGPIAQVTTWE